MNEVVKFLTVGLVTDDDTPVDLALTGVSTFLSVCFKLDLFRVIAEIGPGHSKDPSLGELWCELPADEGKFTFELATELPFFLPNLNGRPEYVVNCGTNRLFVCNRMVRAYVGAGYPSETGLTYLLAHRLALPQIAQDQRCASGIHPVPLRSFVSIRAEVKAETAELAVQTDFPSWRRQLLGALAALMTALRETSPTKARNILPHSSVAGFPVFWLAISAGGGARACEHFATHLGASAPKPMENLKEIEALELASRLSAPGSPDWRQSLGLAEAFHFYGYHELAIVQLCVACESVLAARLKGYLLGRGVSTRIIREQLEEISFSQLLNVHLPGMCELAALPSKAQVLGDINWARKRRNEIVHQGGSSETLAASRVAEVLESGKQLITFVVSGGDA